MPDRTFGLSATRRAFPLALVLVAGAAAASLAGACSARGEGALGSSRAASSTAFANDQTAYDYFRAKGLTNFQAAGIVGNLDQESGVDPTAIQAGGPGRGIAQWSVGGRWDTDSGDNLVAFAAQDGLPPTSLAVQLDFIWFELETFSDYGLAKLRATTNVSDATVAFEDDFEGCGSCDESQRIAYAQDVLNAYGADPVETDAGAPSTSGDASAAKDTGSHPGAPAEGGRGCASVALVRRGRCNASGRIRRWGNDRERAGRARGEPVLRRRLRHHASTRGGCRERARLRLARLARRFGSRRRSRRAARRAE